MLHLIHPALPRVAALEPRRLRHDALVVAAVGVALALVVNGTVSATLATAAENAAAQPQTQVFVAASDRAALAADAAGASATMSAETATVDGEPGDAASAVLSPASLPAREEFTVDVRPPLLYPVGAGAPVGSAFGLRPSTCAGCPSVHNGVDWNPGYGTPVMAMADGVVTLIGNPGSALGTHLEITHVIDGRSITSVYAHLVAGSIPWRQGDRVRVGDIVGLVGATGVATGAHLHFELRVDGVTINPVPWLVANGAQ